MVSIFDIAKRAGVSPTTVSHTISGKRYVSPELAARVHEVMQELSYVPRSAARTLATGRSNLIGLLVPDIGNNYFAELAKGVEQTASELEYNVVIGNTGWDRERELHYLRMVRSRAVDGMVYAAGATTDSGKLGALVGELPLMLLDEEVVGADRPLVISDNVAGGELVARHLLQLGHREALLVGARENLLSSTRRIEGFIAVWRNGGGHVRAIEHRGFTETDGRAAVHGHASAIRHGEVTAVFATNDLLALGATHALAELGVAVPEAVSVVGFDDSSVAQEHGLTSVRQNAHELGTRAARRLIGALTTRSALPAITDVVPVRLIPRTSSARPPRVVG